MYGESTRGFDPRTVDGTKCLMVWGANPSAAAPHVHQHWFSKADAPKIVIDPIRHETAAAADIHLQLYPGTDGALAFAMLHAIRAAGRIDQSFLAGHACGWEEIDGQLDACTPTWGETITGVPAHLIEEAALLYAQGPSLLWMGQGFQRQSFGGNAMRAVGLLPAATGNVGTYGAGFPLSQRLGRAWRRCRLPDGGALGRSARTLDQPYGSRQQSGEPRHQGAHHLEQQYRRLQPRAAPPAPCARARGSVASHARFVSDRYRQLRRLRATGGELPRVRRRGHVLLQLFGLGAGEGAAAARRIIAQPGDRPSPRRCHGIDRPGTV